jgi:Ni,Fe-hydrogenase I small subunit
MAVTRREFITTLGMLAAAVGIGEADLAKVTEAFAHGGAWSTGGWTDKPKVIWVHGAECTGCSTSLLSLFEDATGVAVPGVSALGGDVLTAQALGFITGNGTDPNGYPVTAGNAVAALESTANGHPNGHRTLFLNGLAVDGSEYAVNIADVLIDFIDLQYHETVMAAGGDGAYAYLAREMASSDTTPFVLVCEGAAQKTSNTGYWNAAAGTGNLPWCSIAKDGSDGADVELAFPDVVAALASRAACKAVVAIGQCATYGGYPACIGPDLVANGSHTKSMTGAQGIGAFLADNTTTDASGILIASKVVNVPGCPANPWWFTLTVVAWMVDAVYATTLHADGVLGIVAYNGGKLNIAGGVDTWGRLTAVYGNLLHGKYCPRYPKYANNVFAAYPGDPNGGCLKNIGCKGLSTMSSCGRHGWNNAQPQNAGHVNLGSQVTVNAAGALSATPAAGNKTPLLYTNHDANLGQDIAIGGNCLTCGSPCMGCTEKGYPDAMTPFVVR